MRYYKMRQLILIGLLFLTSCVTFQKRPLTFISSSGLNFQINEDSLLNKLKLNENFANNSNDSITIGTEYKSIKFKSNLWFKEHFNTYYIDKTNNPYIDIILIHFYNKKLWKVDLITKFNSDSLLKTTESYFNKKFHKCISKSSIFYDSLKYGKDYKGFENKWTSESGYFSKNRIYVNYDKDLVYNEVKLSLINKKIKPPDMCPITRPPWWYYFTFWRW